MKRLNPFLIGLAIFFVVSVLSSGCATNKARVNATVNQASNSIAAAAEWSLPFVKDGTAAIATLTMTFALDEKARTEVASDGYEISKFIASLGANELTPDQFQEQLGSWFKEARKGSQLVKAAGAMYRIFYPKIQGRGKLYVDWMTECAAGFALASEQFVKR